MLMTTFLLLTLMLANLSFFNERLLGCIPLRTSRKSIIWRCIELVTLYFVTGGFAYFIEAQQGPVHPQHWQFYIATICLFLVFAFPGVVIRYFWRKPSV